MAVGWGNNGAMDSSDIVYCYFTYSGDDTSDQFNCVDSYTTNGWQSSPKTSGETNDVRIVSQYIKYADDFTADFMVTFKRLETETGTDATYDEVLPAGIQTLIWAYGIH